jgi:hypothetical protein
MKRLQPAVIAPLVGALSFLAFTGAAHSYEEVQVQDGGAIEGKVTFEGRIPTKKIVPTKDREICGDIREVELLQRGPGNGVAQAAVYLQEVAKGKPWPAEEKERVPAIDNKDCEFQPDVQIVRAGPFDVINSDPVLHNTKAYYGRRAVFNLALPGEGDVIRRELPRSGAVRFECDAHGWMEAWAYVVEHPYHALTAEDGSFSIGDVPPGDYVLVARQEYVGVVEQPVTVKAGETTQVDIELKK